MIRCEKGRANGTNRLIMQFLGYDWFSHHEPLYHAL